MKLKLHRESKKQDTKLLPITSPNVNRFFKILSLADLLVNLQQTRIPPQLKYVATLPCEMKYECQKTGGNLKYVL